MKIFIILFVSCLFVLGLKAQEETNIRPSSPAIIATPDMSPPASFSSSEVISTPNITIPQEEELVTESQTPEERPRELAYLPINKKDRFFIGLSFMNKSKLKWMSSKKKKWRTPVETKPNSLYETNLEQKRFKKNIGLSIEYAHFFQGVFVGGGFDLWSKSKSEGNNDVQMSPLSLHLTIGLYQPFQYGNGLLKMFCSIGMGKTGYNNENVGVNFDESLGVMYQFGIGTTFLHKFFLDIIIRRTYSSYRENGDLLPPDTNRKIYSYRKKGKLSLEKPIIRLGIFI